MRDVRFITASATDAARFPACLSLADRTQGVGILKLDYFDQCVAASDWLLLIALVKNEVIGVATARVLPSDGFSYYEPFGKEAAQRLFSDNRVGSMNFASVTEEWQGRG